MQEEHINSPNIFTGVMDLENDLTVVSNQDYRFALAIRNGKGGIPGVATNVKGNCLVEYDLPDGENITIGTFEDKRCVSVIYFVWNSNNKHLILRYFPQKKSTLNPCGKIELIGCGEVLNFNKEWLITHAAFVDNKFLYWTDAYTEKGFIEGNPPRKINAEKANVTGKELCYEIHLDTSLTFLDTILTSDLEFVFTTSNGVSTTHIIPFALINAHKGDPEGFLVFLKDRLDNLSPQITNIKETDLCDCKLSIKMLSSGDNPSIIEIKNTGQDDSTKDILLVPINHYGAIVDLLNPSLPLVCHLKEQYISLIKKPPSCAPIVCHILDSSVNSSNVSSNIFQFRTRYWYDDNEKSAWSAISNISSPLDILGNFLDVLNAIEIDFTEDLLNDPCWRSLIKKVEISFRIGNTGFFKTIDCIDICEIGLKKNKLNFYNDNLYSVVASDDEGPADVQVLKHFDNIPRLSGGLDTISDRKGNNRLFLSANLENYDRPDCVDLNFDTETIEEDECLIDIRGFVRLNQFTRWICGLFSWNRLFWC